MTLREYLVWQGVDVSGPDFTVGEQEGVVDPVLRAMVPGYSGVNIRSSEAYEVYKSNESRQVPTSFFDQASDRLTAQQVVDAGTGWGGLGVVTRTQGVNDFGADGRLGSGGDVFDTPADMATLTAYDPDTRAAIMRYQGGGADTAGERTPSAAQQFPTGQTINGVYYTPQELSEGQHLVTRTGPPVIMNGSPWSERTVISDNGFSSGRPAQPPASPLLPAALALGLAKLLGMF